MEDWNCGSAKLPAGSRKLLSYSAAASWEMGKGARLTAGRKVWEPDEPLPQPDFHHCYWKLKGCQLCQLLEAIVLLEAVNQGEKVELKYGLAIRNRVRLSAVSVTLISS